MVARYGRTKVDPSLLKTADKKSGLGMIDAVELWNEPNLSDPGWGPFVGTMPQFFEIMRAALRARIALTRRFRSPPADLPASISKSSANSPNTSMPMGKPRSIWSMW